MNEFRKFLNQFKCEKGQPFTHTSMGKGGGAGSYFIPRVRQGEFFEQYTREMIRPGALLHLTERPTDPSPMRTDLDFRFTLPADGVIARCYTRENIERIVTCYCAVIADYVQVMPDTPIVAYVLEKPDATEYRGKMKDGVHIIWPAVVVSHNVHHLIRKRVLDMSAELFHGMSICNDYEDVIDKAIIDKNNWQMYGSSKPDSDAYQVTAIYEWVPTRPEDLAATQASAAAATEAAMEAAGGPRAAAIAASASTAQLLEAAAVVAVASGATGGDRAKTPPPRLSVSSAGTLKALAKPTATEELAFVELFSMRHKDDYVSIIRNEKVGEINEYIRHVLPATDERRANKLKSQIFANTMNYVRNFAGQEELSLARRLVLECLSQRRADNYEDWIKCGWALRNIDYRLLETWVEFSKMSSKYLDGQCQQLWDTMRTDTLGMGTLRWWARQDNPIRFKEIMDADTFTLVDRCAGSDGAHFDVAKVVHAMFKDRYRYATNDIWYVYMDHRHRWCRTKEGTKLREILSNDVFSKFVERALYWTQEGARSIDQREHFEERSKKMLKISNQLKSSGYKDSVMKECKCMFTDELFDQLLDSQPHLLCFENGVYDLKMHEFRDGLPDDYVSFCTKRYYIPYNPCSEEAQDIRMYFTQVFTNDSVRRYMMDLLASMVDGSMRQEKFYVFTGSGCHAADTPILMYDGTKRAVQDVAVGDLLMGDDSTPRAVSKLFRGTDVMYEILPAAPAGPGAPAAPLAPSLAPFVVNQDHVLSLKVTAPIPAGLFPRAGPNGLLPGDVLDIKVRELLATVPSECYTGAASCLALYQPARAGATEIARPLRAAFAVARLPDGADDRYFGFELDGNHRYLTGDFVVHHNSNSKSMVMQLVQKAVGEYYCILPIALLTQKRTASNSAQSELERTKGRRIAVMQEPGESERLNIGLMKELSGGDIIQCRGLFKEPIEFRPQFKMIMTCNELPEVPSDDGGTWRRIRVIEFTSKFTDTPDPKNNREFPMDSELTTKMDRWADTFISMILDHHSRMDAKNIVEPPEVRVATESYKKNNDVIGQFVNDCLRAEPDSPDRMQLQKGFTAFKMWANQVVPKGKKIPDRNQFRSYIEKLYGAYPSDGKGWKGVRCISGGDGGGDAEEEAAPPVTPTAAALAPAAATPSKRAAPSAPAPAPAAEK